MSSLSVKERISDISKRCGMSEDIIRRVLDAERQSIVESLKRGERATLIGRCILEPDIRSCIRDRTLGRKIVVKAKPTISLLSELEGVDKFLIADEEDDKDIGIVTHQLSSLT